MYGAIFGISLMGLIVLTFMLISFKKSLNRTTKSELKDISDSNLINNIDVTTEILNQLILVFSIITVVTATQLIYHIFDTGVTLFVIPVVITLLYFLLVYIPASILSLSQYKLIYKSFNGLITIFVVKYSYISDLIDKSSESKDESVLTDRRTRTETEIREIIEDSSSEGSVDEVEADMIQSVFEIDDLIAQDIMVPKPDVDVIYSDMTLSEVYELIQNGTHTRYPVLTKEENRVVGFIDAKDMIRVSHNMHNHIEIENIVRDILKVPETTKVNNILYLFQQNDTKLCAVINEWGSFEGIITIEDVIETIFGDIKDEFDAEGSEPSIEEINSSSYRINGSVHIELVNREIGSDFTSTSGVTTIAGYVLNINGDLPDEGDIINTDSYRFEIESIEDNRIKSIIVRID